MRSTLALAAAAFVSFFFCASQTVQSQTTIFSENFEGDFPGASWNVGDADPEGDSTAYWDDVDLNFGAPFPHSGNWMGYCAGIGYAGTSFEPSYQSSMTAYMQRNANLSGFTGATLSFWYDIPSLENPFDYCVVLIDGSTELWRRSTSTPGWQQEIISLNAYVGASHTIAFVFVSDDSVEFEGWYLDDILVTASGGGGSLPNLTPYQPAGWSDKIVVSRSTGTTTDSANLTPADTLYMDWAVINNGNAAVATAFQTQLYVDDLLRNTWVNNPPLNQNGYAFVEDYSIGSLSSGTHTLRIVTDTMGTVAESNETDNEYIKTITLSGTPDIRIQPLSLTFNLTNGSGGFASTKSSAAEAAPLTAAPANLSPAQKLIDSEEVWKGFHNGQDRVRVIVNLHAAQNPLTKTDWNSKASLRALQEAVKSRQEDVLSTLAANEFTMRHRFENQAGFSAEITQAGLDKLLNDPRVASVEPVRLLKAHLAQGIPLMNGMVYRSTYSGAGVAVAICDSGIDYSHPRLGGGGFPNSKVLGGYDFGDLDGDPIPNGDAHGTTCAGIAAGDLGIVGDYIGGVGPAAKLYALKIEPDAGGGAGSDAIAAAWDWCVTHKNDTPSHPILVISTSFGADRYFSFCDSLVPAVATAANIAVAAGITLLVSSGNEGFCDSMGSPACLSSVISVGAVYDSAFGMVQFCLGEEACAPKISAPGCEPGLDYSVTEASQADKVTPYSNTASFLGVLAPSHRAYTTDIVGSAGYNSGDYDISFGGTSAACPYAAGAVACLQSAAKALTGNFLTPAQVKSRLISSGDNVTDTRVDITKPRINVGHAIETLGIQSATFTNFNDGTAELLVTSMILDAPAPWISWSPQPPLLVGPGESQAITVSIDPTQAPPGQTTRQLSVASNDPDESPYPGGVFITVNKPDTRPSLNIARTGNRVVVSWTTNASGFILECATNLSAAVWTMVTNQPVAMNGENFVTNDIAGQAKFFRLKD